MSGKPRTNVPRPFQPKTNKGSTYLRNALMQSAWAASHTKQTYMAAQFRRLVRTKGQKRALVAVDYSILVIAYHILKRRAGYGELGGDYFDRQSRSVCNGVRSAGWRGSG